MGKLAEIMDQQPASSLLSVAGIYDVLSEHFNNDVLAALAGEPPIRPMGRG